MRGVPPDLPLDPFIGRECNQVALGRFQIQFHFSGTGSISVESRWELRDLTGNLIDRAQEHAERAPYRIHEILDVPVVRFAIDPPLSLTLFFESGHALTIFDDSDQYESFSVNLDGMAGIYI